MTTRLLWLIQGLGPGGSERLLVEAAEAVDRDRFEVSVAYLAPGRDTLVPDLEAIGIPVSSLGATRPVDLRWAIRLRRRLRREPVEIVHVHSPLAASVARLVARTLPRARRPAVISTEHNVWAAYAWPTRWANALTLPLAAHHFAVSEDVRAVMPRWAQRRTEVLVHGIDREAVRSEAATATPSDGDRAVVLTVANYREKKDYPTLLEAARRVTEERPDVRWSVVGQGPAEREVVDLHRRLGLDGRVTLLGVRDDVPRLLGTADLFVLASRHEGLPVSVMEAFAAGVPVVATAAGGLVEMVTDGVEGRLVPVGDAAALATAVGEVVDDPAARARMAAAALEASARYDLSRAMTRVEEVYEELSARS